MQILLVVILGVKEIPGSFYLGGHLSTSSLTKCAPISLCGCPRRLQRIVTIAVNYRPVLCANIYAMTLALCWIMLFKKDLQHLLQRNHRRVKDHKHNL